MYSITAYAAQVNKFDGLLSMHACKQHMQVPCNIAQVCCTSHKVGMPTLTQVQSLTRGCTHRVDAHAATRCIWAGVKLSRAAPTLCVCLSVALLTGHMPIARLGCAYGLCNSHDSNGRTLLLHPCSTAWVRTSQHG